MFNSDCTLVLVASTHEYLLDVNSVVADWLWLLPLGACLESNLCHEVAKAMTILICIILPYGWFSISATEASLDGR